MGITGFCEQQSRWVLLGYALVESMAGRCPEHCRKATTSALERVFYSDQDQQGCKKGFQTPITMAVYNMEEAEFAFFRVPNLCKSATNPRNPRYKVPARSPPPTLNTRFPEQTRPAPHLLPDRNCRPDQDSACVRRQRPHAAPP